MFFYFILFLIVGLSANGERYKPRPGEGEILARIEPRQKEKTQ